MRDGIKQSSKHWVVKTSVIVMVGFFLTKITGQLRQILIGSQLGHDGVYSDALVQSFLIPDFIYQLYIGGAIQMAIIPYLSDALSKGKERRAWRALSTLVNTIFILISVCVVLFEFLAPFIMKRFVNEASYSASVMATRALLPQALFIMIAGLAIGIQNAYKSFMATAITPALYNIMMIFCLIFFGKPSASGVKNVALGITISALIYCCIQVFLSRKYLKNYRLLFDYEDPEFKRLFFLVLPTLAATMIPNFSSFVISSFFVYFPASTALAYSNSQTVWILPFGIFVLAIANVMLPHLTEDYALKKEREASKRLIGGLRMAIVIMIPCAIVSFFFRNEVIQAIFQWSTRMTQENIDYTGNIFKYFTFAMIIQTIIYFFNMGFYANKITKVPLFCSILNLIFLTVFCLVYVKVFQLGYISMALAFVSSGLITAMVSVTLFYRKKGRYMPRINIGYYIRIVLSVICTCAFAFLVQSLFKSYSPDSKMMQLILLSIKGILVLIIYFIVSLIMGIPEILQIRHYIKSRLVKSRI